MCILQRSPLILQSLRSPHHFMWRLNLQRSYRVCCIVGLLLYEMPAVQIMGSPRQWPKIPTLVQRFYLVAKQFLKRGGMVMFAPEGVLSLRGVFVAQAWEQ